jgi:hypothetical protein
MRDDGKAKMRDDGKARLSSCVNWARALEQEMMAKSQNEVHVCIEQEIQKGR